MQELPKIKFDVQQRWPARFNSSQTTYDNRWTQKIMNTNYGRDLCAAGLKDRNARVTESDVAHLERVFQAQAESGGFQSDRR